MNSFNDVVEARATINFLATRSAQSASRETLNFGAHSRLHVV